MGGETPWHHEQLALSSPWLCHACVAVVCAFFGVVWAHIAKRPSMFTKRYARRHRLVALALLLWLMVGFAEVALGPWTMLPLTLYHAVLGVLGTATAVTAAYDFKKAHARVVNKASGALDQDATVTFSEMIEHSWYQGLNLVQIMFLHAVGFVDRQSPPLGDDTTTAHSNTAMLARGLLLVCVTAPWLTRGWFPVNPFSANYTRGQATTSIVSVLYRLKKYQYLLYKHVLLHGLNISVTLVRRHGTAAGLVGSSFFRLYWCCLNVSYVMEFFLQTLVKKRVMAQHTMLALQQPLMAVSTLAAAVVIIRHVHPVPCVLSLVLNLLHRKHDVVNTMVAAAGGAAFVWWMDHGVAG